MLRIFRFGARAGYSPTLRFLSSVTPNASSNPSSSDSKASSSSAEPSEQKTETSKEAETESQQQVAPNISGEIAEGSVFSDFRKIPEPDANKYKKKSNNSKYIWGGLGILAAGAAASSIIKNWDDIQNHKFSYRDVIEHFKDEYTNFVSFFAEPSQELLLPDAAPAAASARTLVVGLEDTLVYTEWDRAHGHRTKKRPGVDAFLTYLAQFYEIVVFTSTLGSYSDGILENLDPHGVITARLFRDSTRFVDGKHVKDLNFLNRDLKNVIMIDSDSHSFVLQPNNFIRVKDWKGDAEDTDLLELIPFLQSIVLEDVGDVRPIIKQFEGTHLPSKFRALTNEFQQKKREGRLPQAGLFVRDRKDINGPLGLLKQTPAVVVPPPPPVAAATTTPSSTAAPPPAPAPAISSSQGLSRLFSPAKPTSTTN